MTVKAAGRRRDAWARLRAVADALLAQWARVELPTPAELRVLARSLEKVADDLEGS